VSVARKGGLLRMSIVGGNEKLRVVSGQSTRIKLHAIYVILQCMKQKTNTRRLA
jgi:hypothetical protein